MTTQSDLEVRRAVRERYAGVAEDGDSCCEPTCCGSSDSVKTQDLSKSIGYTDEELDRVPGDANLGLGCGNPTAIAGLEAGETVLDLGSGAGIDCFLAAQAVGPEGHVIGVDMTPEMVEKARVNARSGGYGNTSTSRVRRCSSCMRRQKATLSSSPCAYASG